MAFTTGSAVTGTPEPAIYIIPIFRMWAYPQTTAGAVALDTHIAIWMACLTGNQVSACFACVATAPLMGGQYGAAVCCGVACGAIAIIELFVRNTKRAGLQTAEAALMRNPSQRTAAEVAVAVTTVAGFVTTATQLRIGACGQRVGYMKIAGVHIGHAVAEAAHFICKAGFMAVQTFVLLMAGRTVDAVALSFGAVVECPGDAMGFQPRKGYLFNHGRIMAAHAHIPGRNDRFALGHMAAGAVIPAEDFDVFVMIERCRPERGCHQHGQDGQTKH